MSAPEFFIADDAPRDPWVWARRGDLAVPMLNLMRLTTHPAGPALLDLIRAAVEGEVREEWGVRLNDDTHPYRCSSEGGARSTVACAVAESWPDRATLVRRTVITGAWEEER